MEELAIDRARIPAWLWATAGLGLAWNLFGIVQLFDFVNQTHNSLAMKDMSPAAADLYYSLPDWMKVAFGLGSVGGLIGSVLLGLRRAAATQVLAASLLGYVALFAGDYAHGVFDLIEGQLAILTMVVAIATGLMSASAFARRRGFLR